MNEILLQHFITLFQVRKKELVLLSKSKDNPMSNFNGGSESFMHVNIQKITKVAEKIENNG